MKQLLSSFINLITSTPFPIQTEGMALVTSADTIVSLCLVTFLIPKVEAIPVGRRQAHGSEPGTSGSAGSLAGFDLPPSSESLTDVASLLQVSSAKISKCFFPGKTHIAL